jgi:hypothetical protein
MSGVDIGFHRKEVIKLAAKTRTGNGDFGFGHFLLLVLSAIAFKVAVDEGSMIAELGFENWRRHRFGW